MLTILVILLILALVGGVAPWGATYTAPGHFYGGGPYLGLGLGLVLVIILILALLGGL